MNVIEKVGFISYLALFTGFVGTAIFNGFIGPLLFMVILYFGFFWAMISDHYEFQSSISKETQE